MQTVCKPLTGDSRLNYIGFISKISFAMFKPCQPWSGDPDPSPPGLFGQSILALLRYMAEGLFERSGT